MSEYSMPSYFQNMPVIGKELGTFHEDNAAEIQAVEQEIHEIREAALEAGRSTESLNESGQWTAMQRIMELVDEGTWCPLNSLYNPEDNKNGSVGIVKGLGRIDGKWAVIIASDNKKLAGAWVPGQADSLLRGSDTAKRLRIPLVYVLNCSGVKLDEQEKVYPNRRGGGTPFYRNSELNQMGVPVIVGIYGTNPAGGGYHSISPTILIAHQDANMAVGGAGIVGGMSPKGHVDKEAAEALIKAQKNLKSDIPGTVAIHYGETGFFREVCATQEGVIATIKKYVDMLPSYDLEFFRVDAPQAPAASDMELYDLVLNNYGPDQYIASVHIEVPDTMTAYEIDSLSLELSRKVYQKCHVVLSAIGIYASNTADPASKAMREAVEALAKDLEGVLQIHGFHLNAKEKQVKFDIVVDYAVKDKEALVSHMQELCRKKWPDYSFQVNQDFDISD